MKLQTKRLGDIFQLSGRERAGTESFPVMSITMHHGLIDQSEKFKKRVASINTTNYKIVFKNELVVGFPIDEGVIGFQTKYEQAIVSPAYDIWKLQDGISCNLDFVGRYLRSNVARHLYASKMRGAVARRRSITKDDFVSIQIPFPLLDDQIRIATVLTRAEKLIAKRKESIKALDELLKSTFLEMFGDPLRNEKGWEKETLRSLSTKFSDGPFGSNLKTCHYEETGVRVIRLNNIGVNQFLNADKAFISQKHYKEILKKYTCLPGDVLIGTMGDPNIRACILPEYIEIAVNKADCILCRPNENKALPEYLTGLINLPYFLSLASNLFHGQTRTRVSMGQLATLRIPLPPLSLQKQFATIVRKVEFLKSRYTQNLTELENLYASLIQQAFKGELDLTKVPVEKEKDGTWGQALCHSD